MKLTDPNTGEEIEHDVPFWEGASRDDDATQLGARGRLLSGAVISPDEIVDEIVVGAPGGFGLNEVPIGQVQCGKEYVVTSASLMEWGQADCAGAPQVMAAEFNKVKDAALAKAIEVVKRCWLHPSCDAAIIFQASWRRCLRDNGKWFLDCVYQVRVVCFTE